MNTPNKNIIFKNVPLFIGFMLMIILSGVFIYNLVDKSEETSASNQAKSVLSGDEMQDYNSPDNSFTIKMPGVPTIEEKTYEDSEHEIKQTIYERSIQNETVSYILEVHDYTGHPHDSKKLPETKLNEVIEKQEEAKLAASTLDRYNGLDTIEAAYNYNIGGQEQTGYVRVLEHEQKIYIVSIANTDAKKFAEFANSLRFK